VKKTILENPYLSGRQTFMEQYGAIIVAANQWRLIAACLGAAVVILSISIGFIANQAKVIPYAVEFNAHGEVDRVVRADAVSAPNANVIKALIRQWMIGARTVYGDMRALQALLDQTYATTLPGSKADKAIRAYHEANNPYERSGKESVDVAVHSVMTNGGDTWRIEWTERTKATNGQVMETKAWQALVTVEIVPPVNDKQILINPMGVYVSDVTLSERQL